MATRRQTREWAVQMLFELDFNPRPMEDVFSSFWSVNRAGHNERTFAEDLVRGVRGRLAELDAVLTQVARNWRLERMAPLDRNVLRLGAFELLYGAKDVPAAVAINEAVDLAKYFGTVESGRFVNGLLDSLRRQRATAPVPDPAPATPAMPAAKPRKPRPPRESKRVPRVRVQVHKSPPA